MLTAIAMRPRGALRAAAAAVAVLLLVTLLPTLAGAQTAPPPPAPSAPTTGLAQGTDFVLTLLHSNDGESRLLPASPRGGIARFATLVDSARDGATPTGAPSDVAYGEVLISSGDNFLAGPEFQAGLERNGGAGPIYDAEALDALDYDALAIGNHEFDFGPDTLADFIEDFDDTGGQPPFLSANLDFDREPRLQTLEDAGRIAASTVVSTGGRDVAIIGATTPNLRSISSPRNVEIDPDVVTAVQDEIDAQLAGGADVIVLSSHLQSISEDRALIAELSGLDVAIAGGGDELLSNPGNPLLPDNTAVGAYPQFQADDDGQQVPIVTTAGDYRYLGRLVLQFNTSNQLLASAGDPIRNCDPAACAAFAPDEALRQGVEVPVAAFVQNLRETAVADSEVALDRRRGTFAGNTQVPGIRVAETNIGNLFADAFVAAGEAETTTTNPVIGFTNGGGIRGETVIPARTLTRFDTFDIAPFSNFLTLVPDLSPESLTVVLERAVSGIPGSGGQWLEISGLQVFYDPARTSQTVTGSNESVVVTRQGQRIRDVVLDDGTVIVAGGVVNSAAPDVDVFTNSFTAAGGDAIPFQRTADTNGGFTNFEVTYQEVLEDFIVDDLGGEITFADYPEGGEGRIQVVQPAPQNRVAFALLDGNRLARFQTNSPGTFEAVTAVTGLPAGTELQGIDVQPSTNTLFALGTTAGRGDLYTINTSTFAATSPNAMGIRAAEQLTFEATADFSIDFNPMVNLVRVVGTDGTNLRVNPVAETATVDAQLAYPPDGSTTPPADSGSGTTPSVVGAAYTGNVGGSSSTQLYDLDQNRNALVLQDPPNNGTLQTRGILRLGDDELDISELTGFDVAQNNQAFVSYETTTPTGALGTVDLLTGRVREVDAFGVAAGTGDPQVRDIAISVVPQPTLTTPAIINIANANNPNGYPVTGGRAPAGQVVTITLTTGMTVETATATASSSGAFTGRFTPAQLARLADGTVAVRAFFTDSFGVAQSVATSVRKDTVAPAAPTNLSNTPITSANQTAYVVTGTAEPGSLVGVRVTDRFGRSVGTTMGVLAASDGSFSVTLDVSSLSDSQGGANDVTIRATATDSAFNEGPPATAVTTKTPAQPTSDPSPQPPVTPGPSDTPSTTPSDSPSTTPTDTPTMRPSPRPSATPDPGDEVTRVQGQGRTETALQVSRGAFGPGEADAVVLTRPDIFPDALAGTPLAIQENAPLLLTAREGLEAAVAAEITRVLPAGGTVYLLGGTEALTPQIQTDVEALGFTTVRYGGANRFATAQVIANDGLDEPTSVLLADGSNFPDAVAAGAAAGATNGAVLLTGGDTVPNETQAYVDAAGDDAVFAIGGPATRAVPTATPVFGATRIDTAVAVAAQFFPAPTVAGIATSEDFPDALSGGAVVGALGGPLLLSGQTLEPAVENYLEANADSIDQAFLFGGTARLPQSVEDAVAAAIAD